MLVAGAVGRIDAAWFPYIVEHSASISQVIKDNFFSLLVVEYCWWLYSSKHYFILRQLKLTFDKTTDNLLWMQFEQVSVSHNLSEGHSWRCSLNAYFSSCFSETFVLRKITKALPLGHVWQSKTGCYTIYDFRKQVIWSTVEQILDSLAKYLDAWVVHAC